MEIYIFTKKEKIPTTKELQEAINKAGFDYTLAEGFDTKSVAFDFWMGSFEGLESGCDYVVDSYDKEDWDFDDAQREAIGDVDCVVTLGTFSNAQEIVAMLVISSVLTKMMGAVTVSDFFWEDIIQSDEAIDAAKGIIENSREQFNGPSTTRAAILNNNKEPGDEDQLFSEDELKIFQQELQEKINTKFGQTIKDGLSQSEGYEDGAAFASEVQEALEGAGIALDEAVNLAFWLYLPDQKSALSAQPRIMELGLKCHIQPDDLDPSIWLCYSAKEMLPTQEELSSIGELMLDIAAQYEGDFDGWETVPEFGFNPFAAEYEQPQCEEMAHTILRTTQDTYKYPHKFIVADLQKFEHFNLDDYASREKEYKARGFEFLADIENESVSNLGQLVTFSRVMYHPTEKIIGYFYYFEMLDIFLDELLSVTSDERLFFTSNTMFLDTTSIPEDIDTNPIAEASLDELIANHQKRLKAYLKDGITLKSIDTIEQYIHYENEAVKRKEEKIKSLGWITKEALFNLSGGDEELMDCVYAALQKILADEA